MVRRPRRILRGWRARLRECRDEAGDTLIEVLFTLVILGLCAAGMLAAFSTTLASSAEQRGLVTLNTLVRNGSAELLSAFQSNAGSYVSCATPASYATLTATLPVLPTGYSQQVTSVKYLANGAYGSTCVPGSTAPQLLTFSITGKYSTGGTTSFVVQDIHPAALAPVKLIYLTSPVSGAASATASVGPITVEEVDAFGNPATSAESVTLTSSSTGSTSFATSSGGPSVTTVTIPAGSSTATFYYGDTLAGTPTLSASATGLTSATQQETIIAAAANKLKFLSSAVSGTASLSANEGPITVEETDAFGNVSITAVTVNLGSSSTGTTVFAGSSGGSAVTSVTIAAGSSTAVFYYGDTRAGTPTITASGGGLSSATQQETVTAGVAKKLLLLPPPVSGAASATATIGPLTVEEEDTFGNVSTSAVTVSVGSSSTGTNEFAATSGGAAVTSVSIAAGSSTATFYYGDTLAGTPTITVSSAGLTGGTQQVTVVGGAASKLKFLSAPVSGATSASATMGPITVQEVDAFGNPSTSAETVNLGSSSTGTYVFATSSGGAPVTSVTIPAGSSTATFYYGDTKAGTPTVAALAVGLTSATQQETVTGLSLPSITSPTAASPASVKKKTASATITITGSGFANNATVTVSGSVVTVTKVVVNSSTSITITVSTTNSTGTFNLTVTDPGVGAATSNSSIVVIN